MSIKIENLNYVYSKGSPYEKQALSDINLTIEDGEFFGIIGHTGSGKSTLINHFNALTKVQSGSIVVDDMSLTDKKIDYKKLRSHVGMVFQYPEYQLFDETVAKDVAFGPKNVGVKEEEIYSRVKEAIYMVGLDYEEIKDRSPFEISGGQKRRVALAGVIAMRPKILVLDEPTAGLDPRGKKEILQLIKSIKKQMCPTIVMISHNMDEVASNCSRVGVMAEGKLVCTLAPSQLFSQKQLLAKYNIAMPIVTNIASMLAGRGMDIEEGIVSSDALIAAIARCKGVENA